MNENMDKMNGNNENNLEINENNDTNGQQNSNNSDNANQNLSSDQSVDNPMNTSLYFGRKRFFNRKSATDANTGDPVGQRSGAASAPAKQRSSKWPNLTGSSSGHQLSSNSTNGFANSNDLSTDEMFFGDGLQFGAKLIGHEFVADARGEHMCQQSIKKLKILQRGLGGHKRKVIIFISFDGIKIRDTLTSELIYHHSVPQISFISRDETDTRAFGYVFGSSTTGHQFIALKTNKEALPIMSAIGQLFAATLLRKKNEIIGESGSNVAINDQKSRRESSISSVTLRPSRSESPNVPSMPAPPPPTARSIDKSTTGAVADEIDFFSSFEPMDSVFESDFKVNNEKLNQIPVTGSDALSADPFAESFGSMSVSSGDWANFDDDQSQSASGSSLQQSLNNSHSLSKPYGISVKRPKAPIASSFSDSLSSMALKELFGSVNHNQLNSTPAPLSPSVNSEPQTIPPRAVDRNSQPFVATSNQSTGSTTSSSDRYACFAEIHSISSSIFDSLCDQMAADAESQLMADQSNYKSSKSLNSSQNGGFGEHPNQLSSSLNTRPTGPVGGHTRNVSYFSFDNPLNSEQQKQNFLRFNQTENSTQNQQNIDFNANRNSQQFELNFTQNPVEYNAQQWDRNRFQYNKVLRNSSEQESNVWSTSSSISDSQSLANSQLSGASSPPPNPMIASGGFGINRSMDMLDEVMPVFAELDPLGKDRPFVDRSQFFAEQKLKPSLRTLNPSEMSTTNTNNLISNRTFGSNSPPIYSSQTSQSIDSINQTHPNVSSTRRQLHSSNANPFSNSSASSKQSDISSISSRMSPNPFNPFNTTCALNPTPPPIPTNPTPPPTVTPPPPPAPPPRPPSRDAPSVPPRNDLSRYAPPPTPPELAPPLPRRRTTVPEHRYLSFDSPGALNRQQFDPFSTSSTINNNFIDNTNFDDLSAPPLPNPQRKVSATPLPGAPPLPTAPQPMARKMSAQSALNWDPFNCAFVDNQLSANNMTLISNNSNTNRNDLNFSTDFVRPNTPMTTTSTPKQLTSDSAAVAVDPVPNFRQFDLKLSEIKPKSRYDWLQQIITDDNNTNSSIDKLSSDSSVGQTPTDPPEPIDGNFCADFSTISSSSSSDTTADSHPMQKTSKLMSKLDLKLNLDSNLAEKSNTISCNSTESRESVANCVNNSSVSPDDHISPPERNIFIVKSDPFADDFFAD